MIEIIPPNHFKQISWKNGQGTTTELAINAGGTIDDFDWRLSIASVIEDGVFSNFSGYLRQLILIKGNGIELNHNNTSLDKLTKLLDSATFDGGNQTIGTLYDGPIKDFNIMTKDNRYTAKIETMVEKGDIVLKQEPLCFIYCLDKGAKLTTEDGLINQTINPKHLIKITNNSNNITLTGDKVIVIYLREKI